MTEYFVNLVKNLMTKLKGTVKDMDALMVEDSGNQIGSVGRALEHLSSALAEMEEAYEELEESYDACLQDNLVLLEEMSELFEENEKLSTILHLHGISKTEES